MAMTQLPWNRLHIHYPQLLPQYWCKGSNVRESLFTAIVKPAAEWPGLLQDRYEHVSRVSSRRLWQDFARAVLSRRGLWLNFVAKLGGARPQHRDNSTSPPLCRKAANPNAAAML